MRTIRTIGAAAGLTVVLLACSQAFQAPPTPDALVFEPADGPVINHGHDLYLTTCTDCHRPRPPQNYTMEQWQTILPKMAKRAKLSADETAAVRAYVVAVHNTPLANSPR
jgi:mono/diheme cytochrome c family protein